MSAKRSSVAGRYAKAIFFSVSDRKVIEDVVKELQSFDDLMKSNKQLQLTLGTAILSSEKRREIIEDLTKKLKFSDDSVKALLVLSESRRVTYLDAVIEKLRLALLLEQNLVPMTVQTPSALGADQKKKIETLFTKILGKKVSAEYTLDPNLIGGVRVTSMGRTFDGTISGWLQSYRQHLDEEIARRV